MQALKLGHGSMVQVMSLEKLGTEESGAGGEGATKQSSHV